MIPCGLGINMANRLSQMDKCASRIEENDAGLPLDLFWSDVHINKFPSMSKAGRCPAFFISGTDPIMNSELIAMLDYLERERGINRDVLVEAISAALLAASKKNFTSGTRELRIDINPKSGAIRAMAKLIAVERIQNPHDEILLSKAKALKADIQVGDEIEVEVTPRDFGRIAAQAARQAINQRIRQIEKDMIYEEFKDRAGEIVSGTVRRFEKSDVIIDLGKFEGTMPSRERVVTEEYSIGDRLRAYVVAVDNASRGPEIVLSRSHPNFVRRLFEIEVSEIADRTVELKAIAREAGYRTKVAVHSADPKVDPVGACVGMRGARVKNIVRELNNEKVDIIRWKSDPAEFVREALKPIKVLSIQVSPDKKAARLTVSEEELSKAIGRRGQNARLTSRLVGMDLAIEKDEHAAEVFEGQVDTAAHEIEAALGIELELAKKLVKQGLLNLAMFSQVDVDDVTEMLDGDRALAEQILAKAQAHAPEGA
jgi:N utilization substance protein A